MILAIRDVLSSEEAARAAARIAALQFVDGASTAGAPARLVKRNLQADASQPDYAPLNKELRDALLRHRTFLVAARPRHMTPLLFSRYRDAMEYGPHVDDPIMHGLRTDVSFTLFLTDPASYDGGELVMETPAGPQSFKLGAGQLVLYPSTSLHRVAPVTRGERLAAVGWCQSHIRDAGQREILYDLDRALRGLFEREKMSPEVDLLARCHANLVRLWADG